jgi:hypothetical protein
LLFIIVFSAPPTGLEPAYAWLRRPPFIQLNYRGIGVDGGIRTLILVLRRDLLLQFSFTDKAYLGG